MELEDQPVVVRVPPHKYVHVLDSNSGITRVVTGPRTYTRAEHERVLGAPKAMLIVPPRHYVLIENPVLRDEITGEVVEDDWHQAKLRHGDLEIRMVDSYPDPFPLYPGEIKASEITALRVIERNQALKLKAIRDFVDKGIEGNELTRVAGDEWLFIGPGTYIPSVEVEVQGIVNAVIVKHSQALKLRALRSCVDDEGKERNAGDEWLVRRNGAYMPSIDVEILKTIRAHILTERKALHMVATKTFTDIYGVLRKAGQEWIVTHEMAESHICDVYENCLGEVPITTLTSRQYAVITNPFVDGEQRLGTEVLVKGEVSFFLKPGEEIIDGIQDIYVLADDEALLLQANQSFTDTDFEKTGVSDAQAVAVVRRPGDRWMVYGPCEYIPPVAVSVLERRRAIPLDDNEGLYVRNNSTGAVRAVIGETYMLAPNEELWQKDLPDEVEALLEKQKLGLAYVAPETYNSKDAAFESKRDKTRVVQFRVPHNAACQVYDFKKKNSRVVYGPDLVCLMPDEHFTIVSLSGGKPKRPNCIKSLTLMLGPDFMTDIIVVETSDHARLRLTLAYNWHFDVKSEEESKIFNVRDFTGDCCKALASRIRGAVASENFDQFHKHSAKIIRGSVFGINKEGKVGNQIVFEANGLTITNVDIQSVEPVDQSTRDSLQKSVQLAIQITTESQEARARQDAKREEEEAKGKLERQKLKNESNSEMERRKLLELKAASNAVESEGTAVGEARARAEAQKVEGEARVQQAELNAKALQLETSAKLDALKLQQEIELKHQEQLNNVEVERARKLAEIESKKVKQLIEAIGADTIKSIAVAGPELQAKLLTGLGLQSVLITDGNAPVNLFNSASGLVGFTPPAGNNSSNP